MRVSIDGKPSGDLAPRLERELRVRKSMEVVEGLVLTPEAAVAQAVRNMKLLFGVVLGVGAAISLVVLIGTAVSERRDLLLFVPLVLVLWTGLGFLVRFAYRRNIGKARARIDQMSGLAAPGALVRVDGEGLTIGGARYGWPDLVLDEVGVANASAGDSSYVYIERLRLSAGGRSLDLDLLTLKNGRDILGQTWRRMRTPAA